MNKSMKRLLLPLLAALSLPIGVSAGDLGSADLHNSLLKRPRKVHYDQLEDKSVFKTRCGGLIYAWEECIVDFSEGRLKVDDSIGIMPSQVIGFYMNHMVNIGFMYINYIDNEGKTRQAGIEVDSRLIDLFQFKKAFFNWMNTGN